jgi:hypothetical protein
MQITRTRTSLAGAALLGGMMLAAAGAHGTAAASGTAARVSGTEAGGMLNPLNNSGITGKASVVVDGRRLHIQVDARRLAHGLPHAQHIHFGAKALHECPTIAADKNGDFRLTTTEGQHAYGPIRVSLTKSGDTSAKSGLAVDRFPTAPRGQIDYSRTTRTSREVARAIRRGEGVVVIHGVDYNHNGEYDFRSAGKSELDPSLPAEATDPATCGVLRVQ